MDRIDGIDRSADYYLCQELANSLVENGKRTSASELLRMALDSFLSHLRQGLIIENEEQEEKGSNNNPKVVTYSQEQFGEAMQKPGL